MVAGKDVKAIKARLKNVFRELGRARNVDVYMEKFRSKTKEQSERVNLPARAAREREDAYEHLRGTLSAPEFRSLMLDLMAWIETGSWLDRKRGKAKRPAQSIGVFATKALDRAWRKLAKVGPRLDRLDEGALHRLRIQAKKLRYACEFFRGIFREGAAEKRYRAFLKALGKVQDYLGELHDLSTSHSLTMEFGTGAGEPSPAARFSESETERAEALLASAGSTFKVLLDASPFW
jgi:triphosphatase